MTVLSSFFRGVGYDALSDAELEALVRRFT